MKKIVSLILNAFKQLIVFDLIVLAVLTLLAVFFYAFFSQHPVSLQESENLATLQTNLLTASSILSGIITTYLFSKIFQLITEKSERHKQIVKLSSKLTAYRRITYYLLSDNGFWIDESDKKKFRKKFPTLDFQELHKNIDGGDLSDSGRKFWETNDFSVSKIDLMLSLKAILDDSDMVPYWVIDKTIKFNYTFDDLYSYGYPSNQIWYYLDDKFLGELDGIVDTNKISNKNKTKIIENANLINPSYSQKKFDRFFFSHLGTKFYNIIIPELIKLTHLNNKKFSNRIYSIVIALILTLVFGVLVPIFMFSINIDNVYLCRDITLFAVSIVCLSMALFIMQFFMILFKEIKAPQEIEFRFN